jgi:hypothetical protein
MSKVVQDKKVKTNNQKNSICSVSVEAVKFSDLWSSYPGGQPYKDPKTGNPPKGYENQCAINLSAAIHGAGVEMKSFKGAVVEMGGRRLAIRAEELSTWLKLQPFCGLPRHPEDITGASWEEKIKGRTGIVFFADYWSRASEKAPTGDHVDLWNGSRLTAVGASFFSTFARNLGINEVFPGTNYGYSDIRKSKIILFWEIQ